MELAGPWPGFVVVVAVVAIVGMWLGLRLAPRLTAWDDARGRAIDDGTAADETGDDDG